MEIYNRRNLIGQNLLTYIRMKGYSKSSFAKLTEISRPTLNQIFSGESPNGTHYNEQIEKISRKLKLPLEYFLKTPRIELEPWQQPVIQYSDRAREAKRDEGTQELLDDLDHLMSIAALYL